MEELNFGVTEINEDGIDAVFGERLEQKKFIPWIIVNKSTLSQATYHCFADFSAQDITIEVGGLLEVRNSDSDMIKVSKFPYSSGLLIWVLTDKSDLPSC